MSTPQNPNGPHPSAPKPAPVAGAAATGDPVLTWSGRPPSTLIKSLPSGTSPGQPEPGVEWVELVMQDPYPQVRGWGGRLKARLPFSGRRQSFRVVTSVHDHGPHVVEWHVPCRVSPTDTLADGYVTVVVRAWCPDPQSLPAAGNGPSGKPPVDVTGETPAVRFARYFARHPRLDEMMSHLVQQCFIEYLDLMASISIDAVAALAESAQLPGEDPLPAFIRSFQVGCEKKFGAVLNSDAVAALAESCHLLGGDPRPAFNRGFQVYCATKFAAALKGDHPGLEFRFEIRLPDSRPVIRHEFVCPVQVKESEARLDIRVGMQMVLAGTVGLARLLRARIRGLDAWAKSAVDRMVIDAQFASDPLVLLSEFPTTVETGLKDQLRREALKIGYLVQTMTGRPVWSGTSEEPEEFKLLTTFDYEKKNFEWQTADPSIKAPLSISFRTFLPTLVQDRIRNVFRSRRPGGMSQPILGEAIRTAVTEAIRRCVQSQVPSDVYLQFDDLVRDRIRTAVVGALSGFLLEEHAKEFGKKVEAFKPRAEEKAAKESEATDSTQKAADTGKQEDRKLDDVVRLERAATDLARSLEINLEDNKVYVLWRTLKGKSFELGLEYRNGVNGDRSSKLTASFKIKAIGDERQGQHAGQESGRDYSGFVKFLHFLNTPNITDTEVITRLLQSLSLELCHHVQDRLSRVAPPVFESALIAARRDLFSRGTSMGKADLDLQNHAYDSLRKLLDVEASSFFARENGLTLSLQRLSFEPSPEALKALDRGHAIQSDIDGLQLSLLRRELRAVSDRIEDPGTPIEELPALQSEALRIQRRMAELAQPSNADVSSNEGITRLLEAASDPDEDEEPPAARAA
jgi:hypothetical protein